MRKRAREKEQGKKSKGKKSEASEYKTRVKESVHDHETINIITTHVEKFNQFQKGKKKEKGKKRTESLFLKRGGGGRMKIKARKQIRLKISPSLIPMTAAIQPSPHLITGNEDRISRSQSQRLINLESNRLRPRSL